MVGARGPAIQHDPRLRQRLAPDRIPPQRGLYAHRSERPIEGLARGFPGQEAPETEKAQRASSSRALPLLVGPAQVGCKKGARTSRPRAVDKVVARVSKPMPLIFD